MYLHDDNSIPVNKFNGKTYKLAFMCNSKKAKYSNKKRLKKQGYHVIVCKHPKMQQRITYTFWIR
jgi:hypothetical protein